MATLTYESLRSFLSNPPEHGPQSFIVNIDDVVGFGRILRHNGFIMQRGRTVMNTKAAFWNIYYRSGFGNILIATIYVDIWRHTPRGQFVAFDPHLLNYRFR